MLEISQTHMDALAADSLRLLMRRIDAWLLNQSPHWAQTDAGTRETRIRQIIEHGEACGMASENDMAVFAWTCAMLAAGWREKITDPDVWRLLSDPAFNPQVKLMHLDERYTLGSLTP